MRAQLHPLFAAAAASLACAACSPTILSARVAKDDPDRVYPQLEAALRPLGYRCKDTTDEHSYAAECEDEHGGLVVELKRKTKYPVLALSFWVPNDACGTPELSARLESFLLQDGAAGNRAYCTEHKRVIVSFETFLPTRGVEPTELATFLESWLKNAQIAVDRHGLLQRQKATD